MSGTTQPAVTTAPSPPPSAAAVSSNSFPERVWECLACFRSIPLAVVLLSLLALATLAGVLLPQEGVVELTQIKAQYGSNYRVMKAAGLFNVYSSYWFLTLETLFFFNLLFGSFQWLKPAYLAATQVFFLGPEDIHRQDNRFSLTLPASSGRAQVETLLKRRRYRVHSDASVPGLLRLYACKGNFSRLGPVVAHTGILLMLLASVYGAFTGFKAQHMAAPGATFALNDTAAFTPNMHDKIWLGKIPPYKVRINDFRIDFYDSDPTTAQQYYADLSILDDVTGETLKRETISVNHPISLGDLTIYQASFNPTGNLFVTLNGKPRTLKIDTQFEDRKVSVVELGGERTLIVFPFFVQQDPGVQANYLVIFLKDRDGMVGAAPGKMPENLRLKEGESGQIGGVTIGYRKAEYATGLQIKRAPEVPWMYTAYLVIMIGTIMCIFSQRQLWLALDETKGRLSVYFKTNKARLSFLKELQQLEGALKTGGAPGGSTR